MVKNPFLKAGRILCLFFSTIPPFKLNGIIYLQGFCIVGVSSFRLRVFSINPAKFLCLFITYGIVMEGKGKISNSFLLELTSRNPPFFVCIVRPSGNRGFAIVTLWIYLYKTATFVGTLTGRMN